MKRKRKISKITKIATGVAFLLFCLFNLKTVIAKNGNVERPSNSSIDTDVALACGEIDSSVDYDCQYVNGEAICVDSWIIHHDCSL